MTIPYPPTATVSLFFTKNISGVLDANGNTTLKLGPDATNQWWLPLLVRVSTVGQTSPVPYVATYHGSPAAINQTAFVDDTFLGNGDTTSMFSGISVVYGEYVSAVFTGGTPGDTAFLTIYGISTNAPPAVGLLPNVPAVHFRGSLNTEIFIQQAIVASTSPVTVGASSSINITGGGHQLFDMRQFSSYYLIINATNTGVNNIDAVSATITFQSSSTGAVNVVYWDYAQWWAQTLAFPDGAIQIQDQIHGPFMNVQISNNSGDSLQVSYVLIASSRVLSHPSFKQNFSMDGVIASSPSSTISVGGLLRIPCGFAYGRAQFLFKAGANAVDFLPNMGTLPTNQIYHVNANTTLSVELILPKRACRVDCSGPNGTGVGVEAYSEFVKET